jgi:uncharacterized repeat protein (TIGR01451 family)
MKPHGIPPRPFAAALVLALASALTAGAVTKPQAYDEMIALSRQMAAIKGDPAAAGQYAQLASRYEELSAQLGGDRPGEPAAPAGTPVTEGNGGPGIPPNCAGAIDSFASADTPLPINDMVTTTSTITVSGVGAFLHDVDVVTSITHTFAGDLDITVTSPAGTQVTLTTDNGAGNDNVFNGTTWDDDGGDTNAPGPVTDNLFANLVVETPLVAEEALGHFRGEDPNGTWTIAIFDDAGADIGSLASWSLDLVTFVAAPIETTTTFTSADTPLPINDMVTTTSTITASGLDPYLCRVEMTTAITHTFAGDLDITLTSPGVTAATVTTDNGAGNDNVFNGTLWDDAAGATNPPGAVSDNLFANLVVETPLCVEEALGAFVGEDANGAWSLAVFDDAGADTGSLASWSLDLTTCACVIPDADLAVVKAGAVDGTTVTYTITVTNGGPGDATGVVVTDPLPACMVYQSDDCGGVNTPPWTWNIGALAATDSVTCNITLDGSACIGSGEVANTATVTGDQNDPAPGNESSTAVVVVGTVLDIPTLDGVGLAVLFIALALAAVVLLRRPRRSA